VALLFYGIGLAAILIGVTSAFLMYRWEQQLNGMAVFGLAGLSAGALVGLIFIWMGHSIDKERGR
jgi:hypothetical protein